MRRAGLIGAGLGLSICGAAGVLLVKPGVDAIEAPSFVLWTGGTDIAIGLTLIAGAFSPVSTKLPIDLSGAWRFLRRMVQPAVPDPWPKGAETCPACGRSNPGRNPATGVHASHHWPDHPQPPARSRRTDQAVSATAIKRRAHDGRGRAGVSRSSVDREADRWAGAGTLKKVRIFLADVGRSLAGGI